MSTSSLIKFKYPQNFVKYKNAVFYQLQGAGFYSSPAWEQTGLPKIDTPNAADPHNGAIHSIPLEAGAAF
jgi:hypothetical protein